MKFKRLSENKLKIIVESDEIPDCGNFDDFIGNSSDARDAFIDILDKACSQVGFNTKDYKVKIDAAVLSNGNLVFTITKLLKLKSSRIAVTPRKISKKITRTDTKDLNLIIYRFEDFDDFMHFCSYLKQINISNIRNLSKSIELYTYNGYYYLALDSINDNYKDISRFYSSITEFSKYFSSKEMFVSVLKERGNLIIKNNAIVTCMKKFVWNEIIEDSNIYSELPKAE